MPFVGDMTFGKYGRLASPRSWPRVLDLSCNYFFGCRCVWMPSIILGKRVRKPVKGMLMSRLLPWTTGTQFCWDLWMTMQTGLSLFPLRGRGSSSVIHQLPPVFVGGLLPGQGTSAPGCFHTAVLMGSGAPVNRGSPGAESGL